MHPMLLILFALAATSFGIILPHQDLKIRDSMLNTSPGCISYTDPRALLENQNSVLEWYSGGSPALGQQDLTGCLNEYGCGDFSNSWNGNVCGGRGWFKGPPDSKTSNVECFQELAPWVLAHGIQTGNSYYKAQLGRGGCYMYVVISVQKNSYSILMWSTETCLGDVCSSDVSRTQLSSSKERNTDFEIIKGVQRSGIRLIVLMGSKH